MAYCEAVARNAEVLEPGQPVLDAGQVDQETRENLQTQAEFTFTDPSLRSDGENLNGMCVCLESHHHEDEGDGHEDAGETHDALVSWDGHGHGRGGVGHQGHRQREDQERWGCVLQTWAETITQHSIKPLSYGILFIYG